MAPSFDSTTIRRFNHGPGPDLNTPQVFSGTDVAVIFNIPSINPSQRVSGGNLESVQLQTITLSSATSVNPVRRLGEARTAQFTRGARTFAGSMVFTVIGQDPFQQIFGVDTFRSSIRVDGKWHIDQMPAFDAIILCQNESGGVGMQVISDITLVNWGTTYSVDDLYIESTYTYFAEHVSPFVSNRFDTFKGATGEAVSSLLDDIVSDMLAQTKNPDLLYWDTSDTNSLDRLLRSGMGEGFRSYGVRRAPGVRPYSQLITPGGLALSQGGVGILGTNEPNVPSSLYGPQP